MANWFITGASRGIGKAIVEAALAAGHHVAATARDPAYIVNDCAQENRLLRLALDVTNHGQIEQAIAIADERFGGIDILVNNAGYGQIGAFEEQDAADAQRQFATNVFGVFDVTRAVLPIMRRQRRGHIFNMSSVAGLRGGTYATLYSASKFAIEGFSESLAQEVSGFAIKVTVVEPGHFRTDFLDGTSMRNGRKQIEDYTASTAKVMKALLAYNHRQIGDPAQLALVLMRIAASDAPPLRLVLGSDAYTVAQEKITQLQSDLAAWQETSFSTDF